MTVDHSKLTLNKKIRNHQLEQWNFILVAGEDECKAGTVDIRTRENQRLGKMRVDNLHGYFQSLLPKPSDAFNKFYEKAWDPAMFEQEEISAAKGGDKEKTKLYTPIANKTQTFMIQIVADIVGADVEVIVTKEKSKAITGAFPYLETADGSIIGESEAIAKFIARMNLATGLLGKHQHCHAKINEWIAWTQTSLINPAFECQGMVYGDIKTDINRYNQNMKIIKEQARVLD